jgi:serine/threonine-protein kinase
MVGTKEDTKGHVWVLDFGIAKFADARVNTDELPAVGTIRYMPPEQVRRIKPDGRADIYAFGVTFYEVLTGRHPFIDDDDADPPTPAEIMSGHLHAEPAPPHEIVPDCPETVTPVVFKCMAKDRDERYANFADVADDLRALIRESLPPGHPLAKRVLQENAQRARRAAFSRVDLELQEEPVTGSTEPLANLGLPASPLPFHPVHQAPVRAAFSRLDLAPTEELGPRSTEPLVNQVPPANPLPFRPAFGAPLPPWLPAPALPAPAPPRPLLGKGHTDRIPRAPVAYEPPQRRPATPLSYAHPPKASPRSTAKPRRAPSRTTYLMALIAGLSLTVSGTLVVLAIRSVREQRTALAAAAPPATANAAPSAMAAPSETARAAEVLSAMAAPCPKPSAAEAPSAALTATAAPSTVPAAATAIQRAAAPPVRTSPPVRATPRRSVAPELLFDFPRTPATKKGGH